MPRPGGAYKIDDDWRKRVRSAIDSMLTDDGKPMSDAHFARLAGISKSTLHQALSPTSVQTAVMPEIHAALGWPQPQLVISPDSLEALSMLKSLSDLTQGRMLERLRNEVEKERAVKEADRRRNERPRSQSRPPASKQK